MLKNFLKIHIYEIIYSIIIIGLGYFTKLYFLMYMPLCFFIFIPFDHKILKSETVLTNDIKKKLFYTSTASSLLFLIFLISGVFLILATYKVENYINYYIEDPFLLLLLGIIYLFFLCGGCPLLFDLYEENATPDGKNSYVEYRYFFGYSIFKLTLLMIAIFILLFFEPANEDKRIANFEQYHSAYVKNNENKSFSNIDCKIIYNTKKGLICSYNLFLQRAYLLLSSDSKYKLSEHNLFKDPNFIIFILNDDDRYSEYKEIKINYDLGNKYSVDDIEHSLSELIKIVNDENHIPPNINKFIIKEK